MRHLADYVGTAHCRAERLPDHNARSGAISSTASFVPMAAAMSSPAPLPGVRGSCTPRARTPRASRTQPAARAAGPAGRSDADHSWCGILYNWLQVLSVYVWVLGDFYRASRARAPAWPWALRCPCSPRCSSLHPGHDQAALFYAGTVFMVPAFVAVAWLSLRVRYEPRMASLVADQMCERGHVHTRSVRGERSTAGAGSGSRARAAHPPLSLLRAPLVGVATRRGRAARLPSRDGGPARPAKNRAGRGGARVTINLSDSESAAQGSLGLGDTSQIHAGVEAPHTASRAAKLERRASA